SMHLHQLVLRNRYQPVSESCGTMGRYNFCAAQVCEFVSWQRGDAIIADHSRHCAASTICLWPAEKPWQLVRRFTTMVGRRYDHAQRRKDEYCSDPRARCGRAYGRGEWGICQQQRGRPRGTARLAVTPRAASEGTGGITAP